MGGYTDTGMYLPDPSILPEGETGYGLLVNKNFERLGEQAGANVKSAVFAGGASGNGISDDTAAIQDAIDSVKARGGKVTVPPGGRYRYSGLTLGDATTPVTGVILEGATVPKGSGASAEAVFVYDGPTDGVGLSGRNLWGGAIRNLGFEGNDKAAYNLQLQHQFGDTNETNHVLVENCTFFGARKYNTLLGTESGNQAGNHSEITFLNCFFRRPAGYTPTTVAHVRQISTNALPNNFIGCQFRNGPATGADPAYAVICSGGTMNFYGITSVGHRWAVLLEAMAGAPSGNINTYGFDSQDGGFLTTDITNRTVSDQRSTHLSGVNHSDPYTGTATNSIEWRFQSWCALMLHGGRFEYDINLPETAVSVYTNGTMFDDTAGATFTGVGADRVSGFWSEGNNRKAQVGVGLTGVHSGFRMRGFVTTANIPAAAAAMNGTMLIERAGPGDLNLILFADGQRFRIDGGTAF